MVPRPLLLLVGLICACGVQRPAPDEPTWVDDVQPILQANCFGCHGASFDSKAGRYRWDVYDLADPRYQEVGFAVLLENPDGDLTKAPVRTFTGARDVELYDFIKHYIKPDSDDLTRMPPP